MYFIKTKLYIEKYVDRLYWLVCHLSNKHFELIYYYKINSLHIINTIWKT